MSVESSSPNADGRLAVGDWAIDKDASAADREPLLVLERTGKRANEAVIYETPPADDDITVAARNTDYDPQDEAIVVVYLSTLNRTLDEWTVNEVVARHENDTLSETDVRTYTFPEGRLADATA